MSIQIPTDTFIKKVMAGSATKKSSGGVRDVYKRSGHKIANKIVNYHTTSSLDEKEAMLALDVYEKHEGFANRVVAEQKLKGAFSDMEIAKQHEYGTSLRAKNSENDEKAQKAAQKREELKRQIEEDAKIRAQEEKKAIKKKEKQEKNKNEKTAIEMPI